MFTSFIFSISFSHSKWSKSGRQDAIEPAEDRQGEHDGLVLRRTVGPTQQVGDLPGEVREIGVVGHACFVRSPDVLEGA
jgi:hypothetical protein